ncbi:MAG: hypothetical protein ABJE95_26035 [Byssovorax sp.]
MADGKDGLGLLRLVEGVADTRGELGQTPPREHARSVAAEEVLRIHRTAFEAVEVAAEPHQHIAGLGDHGRWIDVRGRLGGLGQDVGHRCIGGLLRGDGELDHLVERRNFTHADGGHLLASELAVELGFELIDVRIGHVGLSSFRTLREGGFGYVDKSSLIDDVITRSRAN